MVSLDKAIIATYEKDGEKFEVFLDPGKTYEYLDGRKTDLHGLLVVEEIFKNAQKAERQTVSAINKAFGTTDILKVLEIILAKGNVQLTTEQRRKMVEEKRKRVMDMILKNAIDPRTNAPIPPQRLELAMEQVKVHIDPFKPAEQQAEEVIKALKIVLPMKFEKIRIAVKVPSEYAVRTYGTLKSFGIVQEQWLGNGDLIAVVEIPGGMQGDFIDRINKATHGNVETKMLQK